LRLFHCNICPSKYGTKYALKTHTKRVHEKLKPFECNICCSKFVTNSELNKHIRKVHKQM
jgi:uncharacterized Zn-finger protein